jgi:hypothetical protein
MSYILPDGFNSQINLGSRNKFGKNFLSMTFYSRETNDDEMVEKVLVNND